MGGKFVELCIALSICVVAVVFAQETDDNSSTLQQDQDKSNAKTADDNWVVDLAWNLLGYATLVVPGAIIIRMIKNSNFNERGKKKFRGLAEK